MKKITLKLITGTITHTHGQNKTLTARHTYSLIWSLGWYIHYRKKAESASFIDSSAVFCCTGLNDKNPQINATLFYWMYGG